MRRSLWLWVVVSVANGYALQSFMSVTTTLHHRQRHERVGYMYCPNGMHQCLNGLKSVTTRSFYTASQAEWVIHVHVHVDADVDV